MSKTSRYLEVKKLNLERKFNIKIHFSNLIIRVGLISSRKLEKIQILMNVPPA